MKSNGKKSKVSTGHTTNQKLGVLVFFVAALFLLGMSLLLVSSNTDIRSLAAGNKADRMHLICDKMNLSPEMCDRLVSRGMSPEVKQWCSQKCNQFDDSRYKKGCMSVCSLVNEVGKNGQARSCAAVCKRFHNPKIGKQCDSICPSLVGEEFQTESSGATDETKSSGATGVADSQKFDCSQTCSSSYLLSQGINKTYLNQAVKVCQKICGSANNGGQCPELCNNAGTYQSQCSAMFCSEQ